MFGRTRTDAVKQNTAAAADLAVALARDKKFRSQLAKATGHGVRAKQRASARVGAFAALSRLATDAELRDELREMVDHLRTAYARLEKRRSHKVRNTLLVAGVGGAAAAVAPRVRKWLRTSSISGSDATSGIRVVDAEITVDVPVSTAYNQWTQFEEFPKFMEGVEEVKQLDDTRLHWVATVGGVRAEWDAKILEQHPDTQISWVTEDGKKTRGTVSFESLGDTRTLVRLSMSYVTEGFREAVGAAAGLDARRVRADLGRFKELIEGRGTETGAWRGDISAGRTG